MGFALYKWHGVLVMILWWVGLLTVALPRLWIVACAYVDSCVVLIYFDPLGLDLSLLHLLQLLFLLIGPATAFIRDQCAALLCHHAKLS